MMGATGRLENSPSTRHLLVLPSQRRTGPPPRAPVSVSTTPVPTIPFWRRRMMEAGTTAPSSRSLFQAHRLALYHGSLVVSQRYASTRRPASKSRLFRSGNGRMVGQPAPALFHRPLSRRSKRTAVRHVGADRDNAGFPLGCFRCSRAFD